MDPAPSFLPEMDPNDRENHTHSGAPVSPRVSPQNPHQQLSAERSPSKEKSAVQHLPSPVSPTQAQAQVSSVSLNFLPAACPPPLHFQALSPGAVPELLCPPCSLPSYWLPPVSPHWPSSSFGFSPYVLHPFSNPPEFWCNPWLLPPILCPQMMPIHQTYAADQASGSTSIHVTPASERREKHAGSGGQRSINHVKEAQQNKLQEGNTGNEDNPGSKIKITDSPGPSPFLDEKLMEEDGFEECMTLLDAFFAQLLPAQAQTGKAEYGEAGTLKVENDSLLEYLDELCGDEDFVRKVESILKVETFMSPLSSDQGLLDISAQEEREQEMQEELPPLPANSDPLSEKTAPVTASYEQALQLLLLDPPGIQSAASPKQKGQNSPKTEDWISCSPLLPSHLLEEPPPADAAAKGPVKVPFQPPEEFQTPLHACSAPSHNDIFMSTMHLFPKTSKVSDLERDDALDTTFSVLSLMELKIQTTPPPVESPSTSRLGPSLIADLLTESLQKSTCQPPHPQPEGQLSSWLDARDLAFAVHSDPDSFSLPVKEMKKDGESKTSEENGKKIAKLAPKRNEAIQQKRREKQLFKRKEGDKRSQKTKITSTGEQLLEMAKKEKLKNPKAEAGKQGEPSNPTFCGETGVNKTLFSTPKRVQPTPTTRRKIKRSQEDREQTGKSSPEGEIEGMKLQPKEIVQQNVPVISPVKRSRSTRDGEEKAGPAKKIREKTVSAHPTKEGKAPLDEGSKPGRPSSCWKSTSANTSVTTSGSPPPWCQKGTIGLNMRPQVQTSTTSSRKPSPGAGAQDDEEPRGERPSLTGRGRSTGNARMGQKQHEEETRRDDKVQKQQLRRK